jgi:hypothetical protein
MPSQSAAPTATTSQTTRTTTWTALTGTTPSTTKQWLLCKNILLRGGIGNPERGSTNNHNTLSLSISSYSKAWHTRGMTRGRRGAGILEIE